MVIGFIGLGNMASAMVRGIAAAQLEGVTLCGHNPHPEKAKELVEQCGLRLLPSNQAVLDASDVVVLAVKPQILEGVLAELAPPSGRLFISVAAGKELAARAIHALSGRKSGPFVTLSAANITPERMEIELFGTESNGT